MSISSSLSESSSSPSLSPSSSPPSFSPSFSPSLSSSLPSYSFACGGWLQFYLFGVGKYLQENSSRLHAGGATVCGCSAGALAAVGLGCDGDYDAAIEFCKDDCIPRAYNRGIVGIFRLHEYVNDCLDYSAKLYNYQSFKMKNIEIQIAITSLPYFEKKIIKDFTSAEDLKQCLLASSAAFPFAPLVYLRGKWCVDGGFTDFQPIVDENTITISPFYFSDTDIKPSRYVPLWWALFPPNSRETVDWLYRLGYDDAHAFFSSRSLGSKGIEREEVRERRSSHPFDVPKRISMHRFLGFDLSNATHASVGAIMDFSLYILLLFVWKPFSICLIYIELLIVFLVNCFLSLLHEFYDISPMICLLYGFFAPYLTLSSSLLLSLSGLMMVNKVFLFGLSSQENIKKLGECLNCLSCSSLLIRLLPAPPSLHPPSSHLKLQKISFIYRLVRHFI